VFRVFRVFRGYISGAVEWPAFAASPELLTGDFGVMNFGMPNQIAAPPFALRTWALEFWIFQESGLGGR